MVEISLSGSGEGPGWATSRPTLQALFTPPRRRHAVAHGLDRHRRCWGDDLPQQPTGLMLKEFPAHVRSYFQHPKVRYAAATIL